MGEYPEAFVKYLFSDVHNIFVPYVINEILMKKLTLVDKYVMQIIHSKWRREYEKKSVPV